MQMIRASELAKTLGLSKGRISQLVGQGKLDGCFTGAGTARRFDLAACADALGKRLDPGQKLGNGAATQRRIAQIASAETGEDDAPERQRPSGEGATVLGDKDPDRYEMARTQKAEEEARRLRRQNALDEGLFVLATEAGRQTARLIAQEVAEFETVLRDGARRVADEMGVDYKAVRQVMLETWRAHRAARSVKLQETAEGTAMTEAEKADDI